MSEPMSASTGSTPAPKCDPGLLAGDLHSASAPRPLASYGIAAGLVAVAFLLRLALFGGLTNRLPFSFFLPAAVIAAWYGGMGPGLFAAGAGLLLGDYFFLPPHKSLGPIGEAERTAIGVYGVTSTIAVMLIENLHGKIRRLRRGLKRSASEECKSGSSDPG